MVLPRKTDGDTGGEQQTEVGKDCIAGRRDERMSSMSG